MSECLPRSCVACQSLSLLPPDYMEHMEYMEYMDSVDSVERMEPLIFVQHIPSLVGGFRGARDN